MTRLSNVLLLACSACWGEGPRPQPPTAVEVVYTTQPDLDSCNPSLTRYLGDLAIADDVLATLEYQWHYPECGQPSGVNYELGGNNVPLDTRPTRPFNVGNTKGYPNARVATANGRTFFAINRDEMQAEMKINYGMTTTDNVTYANEMTGLTGSVHSPSGVIADSTYLFIAVTAGAYTDNGIDFNSPEWPCCGAPGNNNGATPHNYGWRVPIAELLPPSQNPDPPEATMDLGAEPLYTGTLKTGMVANTSTLIFVTRAASNGLTKLWSVPKDPPNIAPTELTTIENNTGIIGGLAADDSALYWLTTPSFARSPVPAPGCKIFKKILPSGAVGMIFESTEFYCSDIALDSTHLYFTIINPYFNSDGNSSAEPRTRGIGLGRLQLDNPSTAETALTGVDEDYQGARRIYADGETIYLVDPFSVARLEKDALAGKHDF